MSAVAAVRGFPCSPAQARWAALAERSGRPRGGAVWRLPDGLEPGEVERRLADLAARFEILRTRLVRPPGRLEPLQVIAEPGEEAIPFALATAPVRTPAEALARLDAVAPDAPLAGLVAPGPEAGGRSGRGGRLLALSWPAAALDRRSVEILGATLFGGSPPGAAAGADDDEPMQFADYAAWHRETLAASEREAEHFAALGLPELLAARLPAERPPAAVAPVTEPVEASVEAPVEATLIRTAQDLAAAHTLAAATGVRLDDLLPFAWGSLLAGLAGRGRIALALSLAGREFAEVERALGVFVRPLALALDLGAPPAEGDEPFADLARRAARDLAAARERADGFAWERLGAEAGGEAEPLAPRWSFAVGGVAEGALPEISRPLLVRLGGDLPAVELALPAGLDGAPVVVRVDPARVADAAGEASRLAERFLALIRAAAAAPRAPLAELEWIGPAERAELIVERNRTAVAFAGAGSLERLVAAQAARTPEAVAVALGGRTWTYAELGEAAARIAERLRGLGVGPETRVAIVAERSFETIAGLLGILAAGGAWVPLDPEHPRGWHAAIAAAAAPRLMLAHAPRGALAAALDLPFCSLESALESAPEPEPGEGEIRHRAPDELPIDERQAAYVLFTSGSTGRPKGVVVSRGAIANRILWTLAEHPLGPEDRVLQKTALTFDASIWEVFAPLAAGALLVLAEPGEGLDMGALATRVAADRITVLQLVPTLVRALLAEPGLAGCTTLRRLFCGGEPLGADLVRGVQAALPEVEVINLYGPTEAAIDAASARLPRGFAADEVPIGRPIANLRATVVSRGLVPLPEGAAGELLLGGAGLARGYAARADLTAERFVPDPSAALRGDPGARVYRTGDLARWGSDGALHVLGRVDRQVKVRGVRVELGEIESRLLEIPGVLQATVQLREPPGGGDRRLIAWVAGARGAELDGRALRERLAAALPSALLPAAIVPLTALPRTAGGKVDVAALAEPQGPVSPAAPAGGARPRTAIEEIVVGLFSEVLRRDQVDVDEGFFDLGGHSLSATQVVSRARQTFGVELKVADLFDAPTAAGLARAIEQAIERVRGSASGPPAPPFERIERRGAIPLSFAQQRLWFLEQLRPGTALYVIPDAVRLHGDLDVAALRAALAALIVRHEALRTSFPTLGGEAVQWIHPAASAVREVARLPLVDLAGLAASSASSAALLPDRADGEMVRRIEAAAATPMDLARGPLLRATLLRRGERDHALLFVAHHIVSDAWSSGVLVRELALLYRAARERRPSPLAPPAFQYADFAVWQRRLLGAERIESEVQSWRERLAGAPPPFELPADRPRAERSSDRGRTRPILMPASLLDRLQRLARAEAATLPMVVHAAFFVLLRRLTGCDDLVVGADVANRNRLETEGMLGFFVNQLALRASLAGDPTFRELIGRVRETALHAYGHQDLPFDVLVDRLGLERGGGRPPLFSVKLFFENTPKEPIAADGGLRIESIEIHPPVAKLDWTVALWERPEGLVGWTNWNLDLFDEARVERWVRWLATLAAHAVERPDARLSELDEALDGVERREREQAKKGLRSAGFRSPSRVGEKGSDPR